MDAELGTIVAADLLQLTVIGVVITIFVYLRAEGWSGINIRCHHFFANFGHLLYLTTTGKVIRTVPQNDLSQPTNETIGTFADFNPMDGRFHKFLVNANSHSMSMHVDGIGNTFTIADMPHVFPSGKILFQTYNCRVGIKSISISIT